jgi:endonuclease/exonuclease/phosphatase family metal-dependent hydrolase
MSRRTHGLVALVATGILVVLVAVLYAPADTPGTRSALPSPDSGATTESVPTEPPTTAASSAGSPSTAPEPPAGSPAPDVPGTTIAPCERKGRTVPLTVVTFNIHSAIGPGGFELELIGAEIAASDPDVVLLQEVDNGRLRSRFVDEAAYLADLLGMDHVFASNVVRPGRRLGDPVSHYGTAVLTRLRVESRDHVMLPNRAGRQPRGLQHLVVRLKGRQVSIYNAHLDHTTPSLRQEQMRRARDIVGVDGDPVIFGGDFNASAGSATLALALDPAHTDLVDPWPLVGDGDGLTAPNNAPRSRIDFLLADDEWRPTVMATWQSAVSDHRGVVGRFLLRSPRVCR